MDYDLNTDLKKRLDKMGSGLGPMVSKPATKPAQPMRRQLSPDAIDAPFAPSSRTSQIKSSPVAKPATKPASKSFGVIDFGANGGHTVLHGLANTKKTRYQLYKQVGGISNKTSVKDAITKELSSRITRSGTLTKSDAKHALWKLQKAGTLTQGQVNRTLSSLGN